MQDIRTSTSTTYYENRDRVRDSIFQKTSKEISDAIIIGRVDKKVDIISVKIC